MLSEAASQGLTIAVVVGIGLIFWTQKQLWARWIGGICFFGAAVYALGSGAFLTVVAIVGGVVGLFWLMRRRRRNRQNNERERERAAGVTVNNAVHNNFNN